MRAEVYIGEKEASANFLTNPLDRRSTLRPADVMVYRWVREKHACVDFTGLHHLWDEGLGLLR